MLRTSQYKYSLLVILCLLPAMLLAGNEDRYELKQLSFEGNSEIPSNQLELVILSRETPNWFLKTLNSISSKIGSEASYIDESAVPEDVRSLTEYYKDKGFFIVKITSSVKRNDEKKTASLTFNISEGPQFYFKTINYQGLDNIPEFNKNLIPKLVSIDTGKAYSREGLEQSASSIINSLMDHGYMLASAIMPFYVDIDTNTRKVNATINFNTDARYKLSEVRVERKGKGKDLVEDELLSNIAGLYSGAYYSADEMNRAQVRLYKTNLFSSVLVNGIVADTNKSTVPLLITADIGLLKEISPEILVNNQENAINFGVGANYTIRNFMGGARTITFASSIALEDIFNIGSFERFYHSLALNDTSLLGYADARATLTQPYIFGKPIFSKIEGYYTLNKRKEYRSISYGGKLSLDFELPKITYFNSLTTYYNVEHSKLFFQTDYIKRILKNKTTNIPPDRLDSVMTHFGSAVNENFSSIIGAEFGANRTDDILFPSEGYSLYFVFEEANFIPKLIDRIAKTNLTNSSLYYKAMATWTYFPKVYFSNKNALGMKLKIGYMQAYSGEANGIPITKTFYGGGSNSVRGWRTRELVPSKNLNILGFSYQDLIDYYLQNAPLGGTFLFEGSFETRNRLIGPLGCAFFVDYGNVFDGYKQFRFDKVAVAAGLGLRYYPDFFAPIRIDFGFRIYDPENRTSFFKKKIFQDTFQLHLGIGEAF